MKSDGHGAIVESSVPGRIRVRLPQRERREDVLADIKSILEDVDGIRQIRANLDTGSVLIEHDPRVVRSDELLDVARAADLILEPGEQTPRLVEELTWPEVSRAARNVIRSFRKFDRAVGQFTGGIIDGKMLIILLLLLVGIARALRNGKNSAAPWHTLIWYAYSVFMQWHHPSRPVPRRAG